MAKKFVLDRMELLKALRRLLVVSNDYTAEVSLTSSSGNLTLCTFTEGVIAVEEMSVTFSVDDEEGGVVVSLDKFYSFIQVRHESTVVLRVNKKSVTIKTETATASLQRKSLRLEPKLPNENDIVGKIPSGSFDDLARVANISDHKNAAMPVLGGVYFMITPGDIRALAANGIAFGYSWFQDEMITTTKKEQMLLPAKAVQIAQKYDWQGVKEITIYRPPSPHKGRESKTVCFSNGKSHLYMTELAERQKYPVQFILDAAAGAGSRFNFGVDSLMFKSYVATAVKMSVYGHRAVTVSLMNAMVAISSGKRLKSEIEEAGMEFSGFFDVLSTNSSGDDFVFCLDAKAAENAMSLLSQVDKGRLNVAMGEETNLIYFSTPAANALYGISQIVR